jgi:Flp pilus assembly protein TadD
MASPRPESGRAPAVPAGDAAARTWTAAAVIAAAVFAAYSGTFSVPLLFDDIPSIAENPTIRHLGTSLRPPIDMTVSARPVLNLSLALNYAVSGTAVWSYHAVNLAIHALAALVLFGIVRRTLGPRSDRRAFLVAFSAALLWALHPLQTESVTYIVQRAESLMGLFYLLTLYCFIRGAAEEGSRWYIPCVGACLLGMATKEVMVSAPLVVLLYDRTFVAGSFREAWRRRRRVYAALAGTWVILPFLVLATHGRGGSAGFGNGVSAWDYALTQFPAVVHYLRLGLWPRPLVFDYGTGPAHGMDSVVPDALFVAGLVALTAWALVRRPAIGFLGACFFAILAPSSSIVPVATETMAEHRMYLPLAALAVLVASGLHRWLNRPAVPVCVALAAVLSWMTLQRNETYGSEEGIWRDTAAKQPGNERAHNNLGYALSKIPGRSAEAIAEYGEALRLKPAYAQAQYNLAFALVSVPGRLDDAVAHFREALRLDPRLFEAHYNLGVALQGMPGHSAEAIAEYEEALRLKPDYVQAHFNLGCLLQATPGRLGDAITQYEDALGLRPSLAGAHLNLAIALINTPGRSAEAVDQLKDVLALQPDNAAARQLLARVNPPGR